MAAGSRRVRVGALALVLGVIAPIGVVATTATPSGAALPACTKTWTNTAGGSWDDATRWSGGTVPTAADHVCITTVGDYTVTLAHPGAAVTVASLTVGASAGAGTQRLVITRGVPGHTTSLLGTQGIEIGERGAVELGESDLAQVSVGVGEGAVIANDGRFAQVTGQTDTHVIRGDVVNTGTVQVNQPIVFTGAFTTDGHLHLDHVIHVEGTMWTRDGTVSGDWPVVAYDGLRVGDAVIGEPGRRTPFTIEGGQLSFESDQPIQVVVRNQINVEGDAAPYQDIGIQSVDGLPSSLVFTGTWTTGGRLNLQPSAEVSVSIVGVGAGATLVNEGDLERHSATGATVTVDADVVNRGTIDTWGGRITIDGALESEGEIDLRAGGLTVTGDVVLDPASEVGFAIDADLGVSQGLASAGTVALDGTLVTSTDTAPTVGGGGRVVQGDAVTGTFADIQFLGSASYDPQYTATEVNLVRRASESTARRFVRAAFQDFLGRQPDAEELSDHATRIETGAQSRATLVRGLSRSPQYVTTLVHRFYLDTLGRPGDPGGVDYWVGELTSGRRTVAQVAGSFYASPEYFGRWNNTSDWVFDLYEVFFGRGPTGDEQSYWTARAHALGRTRVAVEMFQSLESRRQRVDVLYRDLLGREAEEDGRDYWAGRITREGDLTLAVFLASSGEYLDRAEQRYP